MLMPHDRNVPTVPPQDDAMARDPCLLRASVYTLENIAVRLNLTFVL